MNHGRLDFPWDLRNPTGSPQQLAAYERVKREQERKKVWEVSLHLHSRLQVHKELQKAGYRRKKNTFKTTYWLMMQKMLWISIPFLIYYFNYLTFYRPPLVDFFWLRFQFSVSWWKLFIIIISKIQNLLAVFIKFICQVQPLENDKERALGRVWSVLCRIICP